MAKKFNVVNRNNPVAANSYYDVPILDANGELTYNENNEINVMRYKVKGEVPAATADTLGTIKVGENLSIDENGVLSATGSAYTLPNASSDTLGGVKVGNNLSIDENGVLSASATSYTLPNASSDTLGGVKVGENLSIDENGVLSASATSYTLPAATASALGGIKIGANLSIDENGVLSAVNNNTTLTKIAAPSITLDCDENNVKLTANITVSGFALTTQNDSDSAAKLTCQLTKVSDGTIILHEKTSGLSSLGTNVIAIGDIGVLDKNTEYDLSVWYNGRKDLDAIAATIRIKTAEELTYTEAPTVTTSSSGSSTAITVGAASLSKASESDADETYDYYTVTVKDTSGNTVYTENVTNTDGSSDTLNIYFAA